MVKIITTKVNYKDETRIIKCQQHQFPEKVAEHFKVDFKDVILYAMKSKNEKYQIKLDDISDLMRIEMIPRTDGQRTIRSFYGNDSDSSPIKSFDNIVTKLRQNTTLTGLERKTLVEFLASNSSVLSRKRKLDERNDIGPKAIAHKKVQVNIASTNTKDAFVQTDHFPIALDEANKEEHISIRIKKLAVNGSKNEEEVAQLMAASFDDRRNFILLKMPPVPVIREKYPLLLCFNEVKNELDRIFYPGKCSEFLSNMEKYSKLILRMCDPRDEILVRTQKRIERSHTPKQREYARIVGSIFAVPKLLDEEFRFIHLSDYPHGSEDIYPHIDASCHSLKDIFFDDKNFQIIVEGLQLCEAPNLNEAVLCLVASFFIFYIDYPASCRRTLTVFEKLYLCANDTTEIDEMTSQLIKLLELEAKEES